ncbi:hypothetical protein EZS27_024509 [termite gut metagenome]|uniref:Uncharacterized protein n=1 Tax=termite gut metagenome TaxID=433724 RepID=A0A5J4QWY2_9ZZZZ
MKSLNINKVFLLFCCLISISCGNNDIPPIDNPEKQSFQGSFESKFMRYASGQVYKGEIQTVWTDTAWINDRIHKQLVVWIDKGGSIENVSYDISNLQGTSSTIASSNVSLRFLQYVFGDAISKECGEHTSRTVVQIADALSPTPVNRISQEDPVKIWVTVNIPSGTKPDLYASTIKVKAEGGEQIFNLNILVTEHTLPSVKDWSFHLDLWQFPFQLASLCNVQPFSNEYFTLQEPFYKLLADAGQKAITTYIKDGAFLQDQTMVKWTKEASGQWQFDYSNFDKYVEKMMSWDIEKQINCFSLVGWNTSTGYFDAASNSYKQIDLTPESSDFEIVWTVFLNSFKNHLKSKGWFEKAVLYMDEIKESQMSKVVAFIKANDANWKIGLASSRINAAIERDLYDYSILLGYNKVFMSSVSTFYTSCSQKFPNNYVTLENNPAEMTWMAWHAAAMKYNGYLRWAYDYWTKSDPLNIQDGSNSAGDFSMIYRSNNTLSNQALSSIRLELLREGIQDYEKMKILSDVQLNTEVKKFNVASGINALGVVCKGQSLIKTLSVKK